MCTCGSQRGGAQVEKAYCRQALPALLNGCMAKTTEVQPLTLRVWSLIAGVLSSAAKFCIFLPSVLVCNSAESNKFQLPFTVVFIHSTPRVVFSLFPIQSNQSTWSVDCISGLSVKYCLKILLCCCFEFVVSINTTATSRSVKPLSPCIIFSLNAQQLVRC